MTRREELAQARERDALMTPDWLPDGLPLWQRTNVADRRFLLGLVDELAAALGTALRQWEMYADEPRSTPVSGVDEWLGEAQDPEAQMFRAARRLLSDLGPDA